MAEIIPALSMVVTTTASREQAQQLATEMVARRLAACAQIDGPIESHYAWQGRLHTETEWRLTLKSTALRASALLSAVRAAHPYEQPQVIALAIAAADAGYAQWVQGQTCEVSAFGGDRPDASKKDRS
jgi:periplasmic divalent cation tolerance protein